MEFRLLMIGAMYENGGNVTHRLFDGHPQMFVYPFESQIGTCLVQDMLSSVFPVKYRWPAFELNASAIDDYKAIIDEECKIRARTPHASKFRHMPFDFSDDNRREIYQSYIRESGRSRSTNIAAFFKSTFDAWKDYRHNGKRTLYVGYSPIVVVDFEKIFYDFPNAHFLHVVRNPWSAYADTKKRPVPMSLANYILGWNLNQHFALLGRKKFPGRLHIVRTEDVMASPEKTLGAICEKLGLESAHSLGQPTFNSIPLEEVYPWGTIKKATPEANKATAAELSVEEREEIRIRTWQYLETFDYRNFI
ncbi:MAG: sulfotransferase [Deltaproteobacteria bacterium]|nr:sulfotransferase [Deltaproteobacteria bacterium]